MHAIFKKAVNYFILLISDIINLTFDDESKDTEHIKTTTKQKYFNTFSKCTTNNSKVIHVDFKNKHKYKSRN